jgi:hypothetical protein
METKMDRRNPQIALVLSDDPAVVRRLEIRLGQTQKEAVDFYIEVAKPEKLAAWRGGRGTDEERLKALCAFLGKPTDTET